MTNSATDSKREDLSTENKQLWMQRVEENITNRRRRQTPNYVERLEARNQNVVTINRLGVQSSPFH